jgi:intracellular septation protein A
VFALSIVLPFIAIEGLLFAGAPVLVAFLGGSLFALIEVGREYVQTRRIGIVPVLALAAIAAAVLLSIGTGDPKFVVLKESAITLCIGAVFLGSMATSRPLIYRLNVDLAAGDAERLAQAEALWENPNARRVLRVLTIGWGIGLILEGLARIAVVAYAPIAVAAKVSPFIAVIAFGGLILWNVWLVRRAQRQRRPAS